MKEGAGLDFLTNSVQMWSRREVEEKDGLVRSQKPNIKTRSQQYYVTQINCILYASKNKTTTTKTREKEI